MSGLNCGERDCREYETALMDLARRRPVDAATRASLASHVESCGRCRYLLDSQIRLTVAAGLMADDASRWNAPFRVEQAVMVEARAVRIRGRRRFVYAAAGAAIAASLVLVWAMNRTMPKPVPRMALKAAVSAPMGIAEKRVIPARIVTKEKIGSKHFVAPVASIQPEQPFIAIPYTMPLQPYEHAAVVRMDVPVTALIAVGLPVEGADPSARVQTEVLVGQDGQARAIRPISISMVSYQMGNQGVSQQ